MLNLFQHPWPGAIQPGWHQLLFAQRHKATNKKAWADRSISPSTVRPATGLQGRAVSRPARRLRGFASLRETKRRGTEGQARPWSPKQLGDYSLDIRRPPSLRHCERSEAIQ